MVFKLKFGLLAKAIFLTILVLSLNSDIFAAMPAQVGRLNVSCGSEYDDEMYITIQSVTGGTWSQYQPIRLSTEISSLTFFQSANTTATYILRGNCAGGSFDVHYDASTYYAQITLSVSGSVYSTLQRVLTEEIKAQNEEILTALENIECSGGGGIDAETYEQLNFNFLMGLAGLLGAFLFAGALLDAWLK